MAIVATNTLMSRARLAQLLAVGFAYPDAALRQALASGEYVAEVRELALGLGLQQDLGQTPAVDLKRLEHEHTYLFERTVRCPSNESAYGRGHGLAAVHDLAEVASFYAAFGFQVSTKAHELADHLCIELEFLGALCAKEAYAREQGWQERAQVCAEARTKFASEHLATWISQFAARVKEHARLGFYPSLAELAEALVRLETPAALVKDGRP
jgi:DMSO reductase family type II enzyme chaperone